MAAPLVLAGAVVGAAGSLYTGMANSAAYKYQAGVAAVNAQIANQNASYEVALGEAKAQESGLKTGATIGATLAQQGASGLATGEGTGVNVRVSEAEIGEDQQAVIRNTAVRRAYGYEVEKAQDISQVGLYNSMSNTALISGGLNAFSSVLGGGGSSSSKWMQGGSAGIQNIFTAGNPFG
jgi:hypothetical protein